MRLAQLARKLAVRPADIAAFLEGNNIDVENGSNFRLDDQMVAMVMGRFGQTPDLVEATPADVEPDAIEMDIQEQPALEAIIAPEVEATETAEPEAIIELIKAPKVELPGLRVVGKIDLPEPKPKVQEEDPSNAEPANVVPKRPLPQRRKRSMDRGAGTRKNPVAQQREREARAAEKKRRAEEELEKERRRQKYLNKVRINVPTKPARIYEDEVEELQPEIAVEPATGLWGRFLRWLYRK